MLAVATTAAVVGSAAYSSSSAKAGQEPTVGATNLSNNAPILDSAAYQIPHPEKKHKGGEDTLFVSHSGLIVGVFDGMCKFQPSLHQFSLYWHQFVQNQRDVGENC